ncbi:MAG: pentapeptide repeat-containing protein [Kineosporiaceae bacterium]
MGEDRDRLRADCARCIGLCCVAPAFVASTDFAVTKPAGTPCRHLGADSRCEIHPWLRERGYAGCTVYDCFGAGQQVCQVTFAGESWRDGERLASAMFTAFPVMRQLHEMLWYLSDASSRVQARSLHEAIAVVRQRIEALTRADRDTVVSIDVAAWRSEVGPILRAVSELVRRGSGSSGPDHGGADLIEADLSGRDLSGRDLSGACLRGARLIGANLRGADLRSADLLGADLRGADLRRADLHGALFLTQVQVNATIGDGGTRLPRELRRPGW